MPNKFHSLPSIVRRLRTTVHRPPSTVYHKGVTLIELLVSIAIIGILAALATYSYDNAQSKARDSRKKQDLQLIKRALQLYYDDNRVYPTLADSTNLGTYLSPIPTDPKTNSSYIYAPSPGGCTTACTSYTLTACLENANDLQKDPTKNGNCTTTSASYTIPNPS